MPLPVLNIAQMREWEKATWASGQTEGEVIRRVGKWEALRAAVRAALTLTVGAPKHGLLKPVARPFVGRIEVAHQVGLIPCELTSELQWTLPEDFAGYPPARAASTHKCSYGHLAIVAG